MKKLLVLVLVVCCSCSFSFDTAWGQMQEESTTVTTESVTDIQGDIEKVTTTTTTVIIENENTGAILSSESTGIVAEKYEGDMDKDWGGSGSINSHTSCGGKLGEYTGNNTCASSRLNSLTTWRQTVNLDQFSIDDGGQVRWEMRFGMEPSMYNDSSKDAYVELKGYDNGAVQWTDTYNVDKSNFVLNSNGNYIAPNGHINNNLDYAGGLDSLYINIGGYGEYMFDSVWFDVYYNDITTTIAESIVYNIIEQEIQNTANNIIDTTYNYSSDDLNNSSLEDLADMNMPDDMNDDYGSSANNSNDVGNDNYADTSTTAQTVSVFSEIETSSNTPDTMTSSDTGANVEQMFSNIIMDIDPEEVSNIQVMVADLNSIDTDVSQGSTSTDIIEIDMPTEMAENNEPVAVIVQPQSEPETTNEIENPPPVEDSPPESEVTNEEPNNDNLPTTTTEESTTTEEEVENEPSSEMDSAENKSENENKVVEVKATEETKEIEEPKEVAEKNTEPEEVKKDAKEESKPEEKKVASTESKEEKEVKEEVKDEPKEKEVAEEEKKEEPKEEPKEEQKAESKETKEEIAKKETEKKQVEKKQEKAKTILAKFDSQYDALAQITTLALVNALGPDIKTYNKTIIQVAPTWYEPKEIYTDAIIPDPLGAYFGVRDSLVYEKMIGQQYE